jgi:hypothetical protein
MKYAIIRSSVLWGLVAVGYHLVISLPFLVLGPMLTIPSDSHGGPIGLIWTILELPAILVYSFFDLMLMGYGGGDMTTKINVFGKSTTGEYATFVVLTTAFWFLLGSVISFVIKLVRIRIRRGRWEL